MLTSLIKSYYKVIILSLCVPNLVQKIWSTPNLLCHKNKIRNCDRRHFEFISGAVFNILPTFHYWAQLPYKISWKYLNPWLNYNIFLKYKMAPVRHVEFFNTIMYFRKPDFCAMDRLGLSIFHHRTKCGTKMLMDTRIMAQSRNSRWRPSAILDFWNPDFWPIDLLTLLIFPLCT